MGKDVLAQTNRTRIVMLSFVGLIAVLGISTYLSFDRVVASPNIRAAIGAILP